MRELKQHACLAGIWVVFLRLIEGLTLNESERQGSRADLEVLEAYGRLLEELTKPTPKYRYAHQVRQIKKYLPKLADEARKIGPVLSKIKSHFNGLPENKLPTRWDLAAAAEYAVLLDKNIPDEGWEPQPPDPFKAFDFMG